MSVIETSSLFKYYGRTPANHDIFLKIEPGEIYGFLGLNGAGKTTLIRILLGMIKPGKGEVRLFGKPVSRNFDRWNDIGYLVESPHHYPNLSVEENLRVFYQLRQLSAPGLIGRVMDELKLTRYRNTRARVLSLGNQQRLGLAKALMHRPQLLILDEPVNGLDPEGIVEVRELLKDLAAQGTTVFLSSHILGEISKLAQRIGIIHEGRLIKEVTHGQMNRELHRKLLVSTLHNQQALEVLAKGRLQAALNSSDFLEISDDEALRHPEEISRLLVENGLPPTSLHIEVEDLEHYFLRTINGNRA